MRARCNRSNKSSQIFLWVALAGFISVGCGEPQPSNLTPVSPDNNTTSPDRDTGQGEEEDAGHLDDAGDEDISEPAVCLEGTDIGHLEPGAQGTHNLGLSAVDSEELTCFGPGDSDVGQGSLSFSSEGPVIVEWTYVTDAPADNLKSSSLNDNCDGEDLSQCQTGRRSEFFYDGEHDHYFQTEMIDAPSSVTLAYRVEAGACSNPGESWCEGGEQQVCFQGRRVDSYACADDRCDDDVSCAANTCATALATEPGMAENPMIVTGHREGYTDSGHFDGLTDCDLDNIDPSSSDIFLSFDNLPNNQDLVIESLGQGTYGFFVVSGCDATSCLAVGSQAADTTNSLRWSPTGQHQSAYIAVRPSDPTSRAFSFAVYLD